MECTSHALSNVYNHVAPTKEPREALDNKYIVDDASSKKFVVSQFKNYKMVEDHILDQLYKI